MLALLELVPVLQAEDRLGEGERVAVDLRPAQEVQVGRSGGMARSRIDARPGDAARQAEAGQQERATLRQLLASRFERIARAGVDRVIALRVAVDLNQVLRGCVERSCDKTSKQEQPDQRSSLPHRAQKRNRGGCSALTSRSEERRVGKECR